jgi:hypothetical protein
MEGNLLGDIRELLIAVVGGLISAALIYAGSRGIRWTTKSRESRRQQRDAEEADWRSGDLAKRQQVFITYLISMLKSFMIGSVLLAVAKAGSDLEPTPQPGPADILDYLNSVADGIGACFYVAALVTILRFGKLMKQYS